LWPIAYALLLLKILLGRRRISLFSFPIRFSLSVPQCPLKFLYGLCVEVLTLTLFSPRLGASVVDFGFGCGSAALCSISRFVAPLIALIALE
jgi:hypothetical protein